jgi:hypothetical protein
MANSFVLGMNDPQGHQLDSLTVVLLWPRFSLWLSYFIILSATTMSNFASRLPKDLRHTPLHAQSTYPLPVFMTQAIFLAADRAHYQHIFYVLACLDEETITITLGCPICMNVCSMGRTCFEPARSPATPTCLLVAEPMKCWWTTTCLHIPTRSLKPFSPPLVSLSTNRVQYHTDHLRHLPRISALASTSNS